MPVTETTATARAAFGSEGPSLYVPARAERRPPPLTASFLDYAPHSPPELTYNLLFEPRLSLHPELRFANSDVEVERTSEYSGNAFTVSVIELFRPDPS